MTDISFQISNLDPDLARRRLPINQAAKIALEKVGLALDLKKAVK